MSVNAANPVRGFQSNVTNLESVESSAAGVRASLQEQFRQDQESMIAALTGAFQRTMQTAIAESEARNKIVTDGLRSENALLRREIAVLKAASATKEELATKVDQSSFNAHWHGSGGHYYVAGCWDNGVTGRPYERQPG